MTCSAPPTTASRSCARSSESRSSGSSSTPRSRAPTACGCWRTSPRSAPPVGAHFVGQRALDLYPAIDILDGKAVRLGRATSIDERSTPTTLSTPPRVGRRGRRAPARGRPRWREGRAPGEPRAPASGSRTRAGVPSSTAAACGRVDGVRRGDRRGRGARRARHRGVRRRRRCSRACIERGPSASPSRWTCATAVVATAGWTQQPQPRRRDAVDALRGRGVRRFIYTNVDRDGMLHGPGRRGGRDACSRPPVTSASIYSGGIGSLDDLRALAGSACRT